MNFRVTYGVYITFALAYSKKIHYSRLKYSWFNNNFWSVDLSRRNWSLLVPVLFQKLRGRRVNRSLCLYLSEREDTKKKLIQQIFRGDLFPDVHRMHSGRKFDFYRLTNGTGCADSISFWLKSRKNTESFQWPDSRDKRRNTGFCNRWFFLKILLQCFLWFVFFKQNKKQKENNIDTKIIMLRRAQDAGENS